MVTKVTLILEEKQKGLSIEAKKGVFHGRNIEKGGEGLYSLRIVQQVIYCTLAPRG